MSLLSWFQDLPGPAALALIWVSFTGAGWALTWLGRRVSQRLSLPHNPGTLSSAIGLIGTMASILIGLVIVALWNDYRVARATVSSEATELRGAARDVQLLAPASRALLLDHLRAYAASVTDDEWPAMGHGSFSNAAGRALASLTVDANATRDQGFDLRARISQIAELRTTRLSQTTSGVVGVLWFGLLTIPLVLLAGIGLVYDENVAFHFILSTLVGLATSIAIFVAIEIDLPYRGIAALSPAPISLAVDQALSESVQRGR